MTAALAAVANRTLFPLGLIVVVVGLRRGRDALAERVLLGAPRLGERVRARGARRLARLGGVDAVLGRLLDGVLGRHRDALAERVLVVLVGAVLDGERRGVRVTLGLA